MKLAISLTPSRATIQANAISLLNDLLFNGNNKNKKNAIKIMSCMDNDIYLHHY